jgi:hypothetical protein
MSMRKRMIAAILVAGVTLGVAGPASANGGGEPRRCNSGRGNGSETVPANDCDPGRSGLVNNGGD